jgi:hypothetical protein
MIMAKYLIQDNFRVLRKGEFVQAAEEAGEFIYDTETADSHSMATLSEIAKANGVEVHSKAKKVDLIIQINEKLSTLNVPEQNKMTDTQVVEKIIADGVTAGKSDDDMLLEIVNSGVSFKNATKVFKMVMEEKGYRVSAKERKEEAAKILADGNFDLTTADGVNTAVDALVVGVADTNEKSAIGFIRSYAKANEISLPKKEKGSAGRVGGGGMFAKLGEWMLENRDATVEDIKRATMTIKSDMNEKQAVKYASIAHDMLKFARKFHETAA